MDAYVLKGIFLVYDLSTKSKQAKQKERPRKREIQRKICDRGDGDERGGEKEKQNAGQASEDYCMKVVQAARLIMRDITE